MENANIVLFSAVGNVLFWQVNIPAIKPCAVVDVFQVHLSVESLIVVMSLLVVCKSSLKIVMPI